MRFAKFTACFLLLVSACSFQLYAANDDYSQKSLRDFVQNFYDWYTPKAEGNSAEPAWNLALKEKYYCFSKVLAHRLQDDSDAQAKAQGDIVGLDFDPFLNSQDPEGRYSVGTIVKKGGNYLVQIEVDSSAKDGSYIVAAELIHADGRWQFVNFYYPNGYNLLNVLKRLSENRK